MNGFIVALWRSVRQLFRRQRPVEHPIPPSYRDPGIYGDAYAGERRAHLKAIQRGQSWR